MVRWCLDPAVVAELPYGELLTQLHTQGRTVAQQQRLSALWQKASTSIGCQFGPSVEFEGRMMVKLLEEVRQTISDTEDKIKQVCLKFAEYCYLLTIPGFGPSLSAMVLGAMGNPWRFSKGSQVLKTVGLDLSASRSGKSTEGAPSISKKGKAELRYALYQAALVASSRDKHFVAYFTNQLRGREKEKGIKTKRRVKLAAKMVMIAWSLMKKKESFDPRYLTSQAEQGISHKPLNSGNGGIPRVRSDGDRGL